MGERKKRALLVNPWIYDFAAYDFWQKPLGLLYIGAVLRKNGFQIDLLDCLDRYQPDLACAYPQLAQNGQGDGSGKYHREAVARPDCLKDIPRRYSRYGMPYQAAIRTLQTLPNPDVILLTSFMTYWYPAVKDMVALLRTFFPATPIVLGGIYATLCPDHARRVIKPDYLVKGEGESQILELLQQIAIFQGDAQESPAESLWPLYDLYPELGSMALLTSRGCPYNCSFCASNKLCENYRRRSPQDVFDELQHWRTHRNIRHVAFFDDALLHNGEKYAKVLFDMLANAAGCWNFYTPNGIQPRGIDEEMAFLMRRAGVVSVRLSYESSNANRQKAMSAKVTDAELEKATEHLITAGYKKRQIGVYVLMGLPDQDIQEVRDSVNFVNRMGVRVNLASFSPIPHTTEYQKAVSLGLWNEEEDLVLSNNSIFPLWRKKYRLEEINALLSWVNQQNERTLLRAADKA